jgi:hypothetical protein
MSPGAVAGRLFAIALLALCLAPAAAQAGLSLAPADVTLEALDAAGGPEARAGAHPDSVLQSFRFTDTGGETEHVKDMAVDLPAGFGGDPGAVPPCSRKSILGVLGAVWGCPAESQVGTLGSGSSSSPFYVTEAGPDEAATFVAIVGPFVAIPLAGACGRPTRGSRSTRPT